jgi:hypothetical protein
MHDPLLVRRFEGLRDLPRDSFERGVVCAPDLAHAPFADEGCHLVGPDPSARADGHSEGFYAIGPDQRRSDFRLEARFKSHLPTPITRPDWLRAATGRHLASSVIDLREGPHIHFKLAGLIRLAGEPSAVGRDESCADRPAAKRVGQRN